MTVVALLLIGGALILHAQAHFIKSEVVAVPVVLEATQTVNFVPPLSSIYDVGLQMDQKAAMARFPCAVDIQGQIAAPCPDTDLRVKAKLALYDETGLVRAETADIQVRGGHYRGSDSFSFDLMNPQLIKNRSYRLSVQYEEWPPGFEALKPELSVRVNTLDGKSKLIGYTFEWLIGWGVVSLGGLATLGLIAFNLWARRISRQSTK